MPLYEFFCNQCQNHFEKMLPVKDREAVYCPSCAKNDVKQVFSPFFTAGSQTTSLPTNPCHQCGAGCMHSKG